MLDHPLVRRAAAFGALLCIVALAVLSLLPKDEMVRTGADGRAEHFIAYAGTMTVCALAWGARVPPMRIAAALVAYAAVLELGQHFAPGRTPALLDFLAGAAGTLVVAIAGTVLLRR